MGSTVQNLLILVTALGFVFLVFMLLHLLVKDKKVNQLFILFMAILLICSYAFLEILSNAQTDQIETPTFRHNTDVTDKYAHIINEKLGFLDSGFAKQLTYHIDETIYEIDNTSYRFGNFKRNGTDLTYYFFVTLDCDKLYIAESTAHSGAESYAAHYISDLTNGKYGNAFDKVTETTDYFHGIRFNAYAKHYPSFGDLDLSKFNKTYMMLEDKENNASVIYCYNDLESINIFQVGDHFCIYQDYDECYMGVSMCHNISDSKTERYAFRMVRYFSTGGQTVCDLIIMEIGKQKKSYAFTVEEYYDTIASKVKTTYDKATNTILIATESGTDKIIRDFYGETHAGTIQKEIDKVYVDPEQWNIKYDADTGRIEVSAGIIVTFKDGKFTSYHDEYQWIGSVNAEVTFVDGEFFLGKTTFKSF